MNTPASTPDDAAQDPGGDGGPLPVAAPPAPISCETTVRRLWDYLDARLAAPARGEVEAHLATCAECPPHFAFAARTLEALAAARPAAAEHEDAALQARVRTALGEAT